MRLMLGTKNTPSLLVDVEEEFDPNNFNFWVINGNWNGKFTNGYLTVLGSPSGDVTWLDKIEILCYNQCRLTGDYNTVFTNFDNPNYVAPSIKRKDEELYNDDIPF
jgi:hypothetical protein